MTACYIEKQSGTLDLESKDSIVPTESDKVVLRTPSVDWGYTLKGVGQDLVKIWVKYVEEACLVMVTVTDPENFIAGAQM